MEEEREKVVGSGPVQSACASPPGPHWLGVGVGVLEWLGGGGKQVSDALKTGVSGHYSGVRRPELPAPKECAANSLGNKANKEGRGAKRTGWGWGGAELVA